MLIPRENLEQCPTTSVQLAVTSIMPLDPRHPPTKVIHLLTKVLQSLTADPKLVSLPAPRRVPRLEDRLSRPPVLSELAFALASPLLRPVVLLLADALLPPLGIRTATDTTALLLAL